MTDAPDRSVADALCRFIDDSPSPYHAVASAAAVLDGAGFTEVELGEPLPGGAGGRYVRRGGSIIAWRQPAGDVRGFRLVGAHTDSPNLRIKPRPDRVSAGVRQLGVEIYGGVLLNSWLDRDLGLSGRVSVRTADGPALRLLRVDEPLLRVPQLAIHLDREISTEGLKLNPQQHLVPMWDLDGDGGSESAFTAFLAEHVDVAADDVLAWDVMAHDLTPSRRTGVGGVFVSAPRLDNLCSSFAGLRGLLAVGDDTPSTPVVCLYDHEEVGSTSGTGADSALLASVLERIALASGVDRDGFHAALSRSLCVSADMAHATHPNYADRHEPEHQVALNGGPVVKVNANQRYASDAESVGLLLQACGDAGVPTQRFVTRTDLPCGSTIGPITAARLGIPTVDVGVAQLAMHSTRELCGADDPDRYERAMAAVLAG
ncbi:MAG: M18 family aminopeptidase [Acidimicrobiia bacterium]